MLKISQDIAKMIEVLPHGEQQFAYDFIKRLVLMWDPDFTKTTPDEALLIKAAEGSGYVDDSDIDWDKIGV